VEADFNGQREATMWYQFEGDTDSPPCILLFFEGNIRKKKKNRKNSLKGRPFRRRRAEGVDKKKKAGEVPP